ncbi:HNH/endonuclease VII fold putative polymorphic toxin [uncultured Clostridium sp.]|uniref:HNH/endonuclease VII fold putative polymorphic toxin n=1 Tax=uncultured Clostridium sp. TaxID=59620 RepID=UPI003458A824
MNNPVNAEDTDGKFLAALRYAKTLFKVARVATKVLSVMSTPAAVVVTAVVLVTVVSVYAYTRYKANNVAQAKNKPKVNNKSDNQISNDEALSNPSSRPKNYTPPGAGRHGAFREAKRKSGIPVTQTPVTTPAVDKRGKPIQGRDYDFGNGKVIRDHSGGHTFKDDPTQNRGPHINDVKRI